MSLVLCTIHSPEQKTESAKNSLDSMSKLFFNPSECNKLHPPSHLSVRSVLLHFVQRSPPETRTLYKGGKKVYLISTRRALATLSTVWRLTLLASFLFYTNTKCIKSIYPIVPTAILKRVFFFQI